MAIGVANPKGIGGRVFEGIDEQAILIPLKTAKNLIPGLFGTGTSAMLATFPASSRKLAWGCPG
jgi:hypothetical protein